MKIKELKIRDFKRFTDLDLTNIPFETRLVLLVGPNGAGKSSLFEAFNAWMMNVRQTYNFDRNYHEKTGGPAISDWSQMLQGIQLSFHDHPGDPRSDATLARKLFYFRSAYRHEADFELNNLNRSDEVLMDSRRPQTLIAADARVSDNYQRMVAISVETLFDPTEGNTTASVITDRIVGKLRAAMTRVFEDLKLEGPGRPMQGGTFFFTKGNSKNFRYKNLSGGEKAAFDLLLDFIVKTEAFDNTVFCIDEPELHMHTKLQGRMLDELLGQLPIGCQLWMSTHSIGMIRRAMELHRQRPKEVSFFDFGQHDFDSSVVMSPARVDRIFWKRMFSVALDELSDLVAPREVVFCEGRREPGSGKRSPTFDAHIYRQIFSVKHPDTEFVPLGGTSEVEKDSALIAGALSQMMPSIKTWKVFDRDDRSELEIAELRTVGTRVLVRRDLESYLWDDEIITALAAECGNPTAASQIIAEKQRLVSSLPTQGKSVDDIKEISGALFNAAKRILQMNGRGNNAAEFARATLAPLVLPETRVYSELETVIFTT